MSVDLAKLKTELQKPAYSGKSHEEMAEMLKAQVPTVDRETLTGGMLVASIVRSEFAALSAADRQYVQTVAMATDIPLTGTLKTELGAVFPAGSQTRANLIALLKRTGTLAESLGLGGQPTTSDIANALRS